MTIVEKQQARGALVEQMRRILDASANRALTTQEQTDFDRLDLEQGRLGDEIRAQEPRAGSATFARDAAGLARLEAEMRQAPEPRSGRPGPRADERHSAYAADDEVRLLNPREALRDHLRLELPDGLRAGDLSLGRVVRAVALGDWRGAAAEVRVMGHAPATAGGFLAPASLSADVIDRARNRAVIFRAGARTVVMPTAELAFARVADDPTAEWKAENAAGTESGVGLERVTLRSRTLFGIVRCSMELLTDAPNAPSVIESSLAASLGLALDLGCLYGNTGPLAPTGVRYYPGVQSIGSVGVLSLDDFADAAGLIVAQNGPEAGLSALVSPATWTWIDKLKDGDGMPLRGPSSWEAMAKFPSNQIPATDAIVGPFSQMIVGVRSELQIDVSREAGEAFSKYQALIRAVLRCDMVLEHEQHFVTLLGIS